MCELVIINKVKKGEDLTFGARGRSSGRHASSGGGIGAGARTRSWHILGFSARRVGRVASRAVRCGRVVGSAWPRPIRYAADRTKSIGRHPYFMLCCFTHRDCLLIIMHGKKFRSAIGAPLPRPAAARGVRPGLSRPLCAPALFLTSVVSRPT